MEKKVEIGEPEHEPFVDVHHLERELFTVPCKLGRGFRYLGFKDLGLGI